MMIKKLMLRLRHWLIKKLGGYTEQRLPPAVRMLPPVTMHPERLVVQSRVGYDMFDLLRCSPDKERVFAERIREDLAMGMVKQLVDHGDIVLTCEPDFSYGMGEERIYQMALCVIPAHEWVKTELGSIVAPVFEREER